VNHLLRTSLLLLALTAVAAALTGWLHPRAPDFVPREASERSPLARSWEELAQFESILWIDARTEEAFLTEHKEGALLLNEDRWQEGFEALMFTWTPDQTIIVYCDEAACHASEAVAMRLRRELGTETVYFLEGGWTEVEAHQ
jgi:rhodanese-related sulfurtransferase